MAYSSGNSQGNNNGKQKNDDVDGIFSKIGVDDTLAHTLGQGRIDYLS